MHCVAVDEIKNRVIKGFNSWGVSNPNPMIPIERADVTVFQILILECQEVNVKKPEVERIDLCYDLVKVSKYSMISNSKY